MEEGTMTPFRISEYREEKAVAAATYLVELNGGECDKYWLNKVMYYVERESIIKNGQPMFFDELFSLKYGPIVSSVKDGIDSLEYPIESAWDHYLSITRANVVSLVTPPDIDFLSEFEIELIYNAAKKFKGWDFSRLHDYFKKLPEHTETKTRIPIDFEVILRNSKYKPEEIEAYKRELDYLSSLNYLVRCE